jgi:hypothetical protein
VRAPTRDDIAALPLTACAAWLSTSDTCDTAAARTRGPGAPALAGVARGAGSAAS